MRINEDCIGCGSCVPYCTVGAIELGSDRAVVDQDRCVECGVCVRCVECPADAMHQLSVQELPYPRNLRRYFSDPISISPVTSAGGRGTEEGKTNDRTGRFKFGQVGFCVELGRPGISASFADAQIVAQAVARAGATFEEKNPIYPLLDDASTGRFKPELLTERVLSLIVEFTVPLSQTGTVISALRSIENQIDTVFSLGTVTRVQPDGTIPVISLLEEAGVIVRPNAKINVGLGRPLIP